LELWSHPWWIIGLYSLTALFFLLFALFMASYKTIKGGPTQVPGVLPVPSSIKSTSLDYTALKRMEVMSSYIATVSKRPKLNTWVTRIFIAIVLQCAAIYLISTFPGTRSPFWLGITLQGFTYGSAAVYYASWGKEPVEDY
jgi:hypothetical protein